MVETWLQRRNRERAAAARDDERLAAAVERIALSRITGELAKPLLDAGLVEPVDRSAAKAEQQRVEGLIERDRLAGIEEKARRDIVLLGDEFREKRRNETWEEYKRRVSEADFSRRMRIGALVPPEAEMHGEYADVMVNHVETSTTATTRRNTARSPIESMLARGGLTPEQFRAAEEIVAVIELIRSDVGCRGAMLQMRVDQSRALIDAALESLARVRAEVAYSLWRQRLPMPRQMVIDMLTLPQPMFRTARSYGVGWPKARKLLTAALDRWDEALDQSMRRIDQAEVDAVLARIENGLRVSDIEGISPSSILRPTETGRE